jgi:hypothetical protein
LTFGSQGSCDGKNSSEFERATAAMDGSSPWMLGEEEGFFDDLTGRRSGRQMWLGWRGVVAAVT